jgi:hypothetical protein
MPTSQLERLLRPAVLRPAVLRPAVLRPAVLRPAMLRPAMLPSELSARSPASSAVAGVRGGGALFRVSAGVAQLVERQFSKLNVASSILVSRSLLSGSRLSGSRAPQPANGLFISRGRPNPRGFSVPLVGRLSWRVDSRAFRRERPGVLGFRTGGRSARRVVAVCGLAGSRAKDFVSRGGLNPRSCLIPRGLSSSRVSPAHLAQLVEHVLGKDEVISSILMVGSQSGCGVSPPKLRTSCASGVLAKRRGLVS